MYFTTLSVRMSVTWKKRIRFVGLIPQIVLVPCFSQANIMPDGVLRVKSSFFLDKISLTEYRLTIGELPCSVDVTYTNKDDHMGWKKLVAVWESIDQKEIEVKRVN